MERGRLDIIGTSEHPLKRDRLTVVLCPVIQVYIPLANPVFLTSFGGIAVDRNERGSFDPAIDLAACCDRHSVVVAAGGIFRHIVMYPVFTVSRAVDIRIGVV